MYVGKAGDETWAVRCTVCTDTSFEIAHRDGFDQVKNHLSGEAHVGALRELKELLNTIAGDDHNNDNDDVDGVDGIMKGKSRTRERTGRTQRAGGDITASSDEEDNDDDEEGGEQEEEDQGGSRTLSDHGTDTEMAVREMVGTFTGGDLHIDQVTGRGGRGTKRPSAEGDNGTKRPRSAAEEDTARASQSSSDELSEDWSAAFRIVLD
ncbi:hypothetical protein OC834_007766, partial [Tilletia horrida]